MMGIRNFFVSGIIFFVAGFSYCMQETIFPPCHLLPLPLFPAGDIEKELREKYERTPINYAVSHKKRQGEELVFPTHLPEKWLKEVYIRNVVRIESSNPVAGNRVVPESQLWIKKGGVREVCTFCKGKQKTFTIAYPQGATRGMFEGINKSGKALRVHKGFLEGKHYFRMYLLEQLLPDHQNNKRNVKSFFKDDEYMHDLLLEHEKDRFIYSSKKNCDSSHSFRVTIKDIVEQKSTKGCRYKAKSVARLKTSKSFRIIVSLGKNTYLAFTHRGELYSFWLTSDNKISYAKQKLSVPHLFSFIAVDQSYKTAQGFKQKIAFLTIEGKIFCVHLGRPGPITLYPIGNAETHLGIRALYYDQGKVSVVYDRSDKVSVYDDLAEVINLRWLLQQD